MGSEGVIGRVFLSYKSDNLPLCRRIADLLLAAGIDVWADWLEIGQTPTWRLAVERAMPSCDLFVPLICDRYFASEDCRYEWDIAMQVRGLRVAALIYGHKAMDLRRTDSVLRLGANDTLKTSLSAVPEFLSAELQH
jgi:hypothetical protein